MRNLLLAVLIAVVATGAAAARAEPLPAEISTPLLDFTTIDPDKRTIARDGLQKAVGSYSDQKRKDVVTTMLSQLNTPSTEPLARINIAVALSKLKPSWEANNHDAELAKLYATFQNTKDPTLRRYLDDALANGRGLYLDAIFEYNEDRVDNPAAVARKFQRMIDLFPQSRYCANAAFYLQQYWTRAAIVKAKLDEYIPLSNKAFDAFWEKTSKDGFISKEFDADARYFRALNDVLQQKEPQAIERLTALKSALGRDQLIYVYQLFKNPPSTPSPVSIDRYIAADILISETINFISKNPGRLPAAQADLANQILTRLSQKN